MSDKSVVSEERLLKILLATVYTEKSARLMENANQYVFKVMGDATKLEIKKAVESLFNVQVLSVSTSNLKGKVKRFGQRFGRRNDVKKAYVRVAEGQTIDFGGQELGA